MYINPHKIYIRGTGYLFLLSARYFLRQFFPIQCKGIILIVWNFGRRRNAYKNFTVQFLLIIHFSSGREKEANNIVLYSDFAFILWFIIIILFLFIFFTLLSCCYDTSLMGRGRKISGWRKEITGNADGVVKFLTGVFEIKMLARQDVAFHFPKPIRYCDVYLFAFLCMCFFSFATKNTTTKFGCITNVKVIRVNDETQKYRI